MQKKFAKILLGDEANPWGEISSYNGVSFDPENEIKLDQNLRARLAVAFQTAPNLIASLAGASILSNTYTLKIDPSYAKGFLDGTLSLMPAIGGGVRGQVVDTKGGIIRGQVVLQSMSGLTPLFVATLGWQLISMITVPKYLATINLQLTELNSRVADIKSFLEDAQYAKLTGNLEYIYSTQATFSLRSPDDHELNRFFIKLDDIEADTLHILNLLKIRLQRVYDAVKSHNLKRALGVSSRKVKTLQTHVSESERLAEGYRLALFVRATAASIGGSLPGGYNSGVSRLEDTSDRLGNWKKEQLDFYALVKSKAVGRVEKELSLQSRNGELETGNKFNELNKVITDSLQTLQNWYTQPSAIIVELDSQGEINRVFRLPKTVSQTI